MEAAPAITLPSRRLGAAVGLASAVVALGVAELVASLNRSWRSPILDVGDRAVDRVPSFVKDLAIEYLGTNDKPALLIGIGVVLAGYAATVGVIALRRSRVAGVVGIGLFGVIGVLAAAGRRTGGSLVDGTPSLVGAVAGAAALWFASGRLLTWRRGAQDAGRSDESGAATERIDRRAAIVRTGGLLAALVAFGTAAGAVGRAVARRFSAAESRAALVLPAADVPLPSPPAGLEVGIDGVGPFFTPNADFYRIDTALSVPQVPIEGWELRITGMIERPLTFSFDDLLGRSIGEYDITLTCVSNTVGGELVGTARWLGVRLDELLAEAGVLPGADQVVGRSVDGYTAGFPLEAATDGRDAIVAIGMNGEPLPLEHGFPARLVVPGLYGYVSATKWLAEIELTTFEDVVAYWVPRGYAQRAPIKLMSRIDSIDGLGTLVRGTDGTAAIGGVAWAQTRGIAAVEVQIDDGPWTAAEMGTALNADTWRQWAYRWTPTATGRTSIRCRAISNDGEIQTDVRAEPLPDGAAGHHQIIVFVE
jgi:DMSO/TMAO reductase YedYZ molybdopterin-dependent catalytic subunit